MSLHLAWSIKYHILCVNFQPVSDDFSFLFRAATLFLLSSFLLFCCDVFFPSCLPRIFISCVCICVDCVQKWEYDILENFLFAPLWWSWVIYELVFLLRRKFKLDIYWSFLSIFRVLSRHSIKNLENSLKRPNSYNFQTLEWSKKIELSLLRKPNR